MVPLLMVKQKLRNRVLFNLICLFSRWPPQIMEFDILMKYSIFGNALYPKTLVHCNLCPLSLQNLTQILTIFYPAIHVCFNIALFWTK